MSSASNIVAIDIHGPVDIDIDIMLPSPVPHPSARLVQPLCRSKPEQSGCNNAFRSVMGS